MCLQHTFKKWSDMNPFYFIPNKENDSKEWLSFYKRKRNNAIHSESRRNYL